MMAIALVYSLPPIAIYFALRRFTSVDTVHR
jgi:ABC-type glycerol-3-phosphate transport system permease component